MKKRFVEVKAIFHEDGSITPTHIIWDDTREFEIEKILDIRKAASLKVGGQGLRYTVRILDKKKYLFYEEPKWFVECK